MPITLYIHYTQFYKKRKTDPLSEITGLSGAAAGPHLFRRFRIRTAPKPSRTPVTVPEIRSAGR